MPLSPLILHRIRENDPRLTKLSLAELTEDDLSFDTTDAYELAHALKTNTHLQILDLYGHEAQMGGILALLQSLDGNKALKVLNLRGNHQSCLPIKELFHYLKHTSLIWLDCGRGAATTNHSQTPSLENLPQGRFLRIDRIEMEEDDPLALTDLVDELNDFSITHLDISGHTLAHEDYPQLNRLLTHPVLTSLRINRMNLGKAGAEYLLEGLKQKNSFLTRLELEQNGLDDDFIIHLASWAGLKKMQTLSLADNPEITEITLLMEVLTHGVIEEISFANNQLDRNSIVSVLLFLQENDTCTRLNLMGMCLYDCMELLFKNLSKTRLVSLNIASCTPDKNTKQPEVDDLITLVYKTLRMNRTLKKLNITHIFEGYEVDQLYEGLPAIFHPKQALEHLILGDIEISFKEQKALVNIRGQNTHLQIRDLINYIHDGERIEKMVSFLQVKQELITDINRILKSAEELVAYILNATNPAVALREQVINYYADAEKISRQLKNDYGYSAAQQHTLKSAARSFLELGLPVAAWRRLMQLPILDAEMWQKTAEAFISKINDVPADITPYDYHLFLFMLLRKTEKTAVNRMLLQQVYLNLCTIEPMEESDKAIIFLEDLEEKVGVAKEQLKSMLSYELTDKEQDQLRARIQLLRRILKNPYSDKNILNLCQDDYVRSQLLGVQSKHIVFPEHILIKKHPHQNKVNKILKILSDLEDKLFMKMEQLEDVSHVLAKAQEEQVNSPAHKPPLDKNEEIKNFLLALKKDIIHKNWHVRVGEVGVYRDENGALVSLGKKIPKGVQRILSVIDGGHENWSEVISNIHDIAAHHGHYVDVKMFFIGQSLDTQRWYQQLESEVQKLIQHYPRQEH